MYWVWVRSFGAQNTIAISSRHQMFATHWGVLGEGIRFASSIGAADADWFFISPINEADNSLKLNNFIVWIFMVL